MEAHIEVDGIRYYTLLEKPDGNAPNGQVILFCHALMSNLHMWDPTVKFLHSLGYTTLRYDHIGHNKTLAPEGYVSFHMDDLTRHMHILVEKATGQSKLKAVIGCSIGGVLALRYAMLYPDSVDQVISVAAPGISAPESAKNLWSQRIIQFEEDERNRGEKLALATVNRWFPGARPEDDGVRAESLGHVKTCSLNGYKILADTIRDYHYTEEVRNIKDVECLIVAGSEDSAVSPGVLKDVASTIARAKYVKMEGAGHLPPMHRAEEFNVAAESFLERAKMK